MTELPAVRSIPVIIGPTDQGRFRIHRADMGQRSRREAVFAGIRTLRALQSVHPVFAIASQNTEFDIDCPKSCSARADSCTRLPTDGLIRKYILNFEIRHCAERTTASSGFPQHAEKKGSDMDIIKELLKDVSLPRMVKIRQQFPAERIADVPSVLRNALAESGQLEAVRPGMRIAVAVGSRGVNQLQALVRTAVEEIGKRGAFPFVIPAMGSHGGATPEGQAQVLSHLGITEQTVGCPIHSSMEVVEISRLENGLPVYIDKYAHESDGIVVINRIKPHTAFRGPNESGLVKMIAIGLGKQKGAESCHAYGFKHMDAHVPAMAREAIAKAPILFGIGTVENAYDQVTKIAVVGAGDMLEADRRLLMEAKAAMPCIGFSPIDVLVIDEIGKNISGDGMDPNITGRYPTPYPSGGPEVSKMVVLDLTEETNGNANGVGTADFTTRRLVEKTDFKSMYANGITSTVVGPTAIPTTLDSDLDAIRAAVKTSNALNLARVRLVRIKNTLHLGELLISESLLDEARAMPNVTVLSEPLPMNFDAQGNLCREF